MDADPSSFGGILWCFRTVRSSLSTGATDLRARGARGPPGSMANVLNVKQYNRDNVASASPKTAAHRRDRAGLAGSLAARTLGGSRGADRVVRKRERPSDACRTRRTVEENSITARSTLLVAIALFVSMSTVGSNREPWPSGPRRLPCFKMELLQLFTRAALCCCSAYEMELGKRLTRLMNVHYGVRIQRRELSARTRVGWCRRRSRKLTAPSIGSSPRSQHRKQQNGCKTKQSDSENLKVSVSSLLGSDGNPGSPLPVDFGGRIHQLRVTLRGWLAIKPSPAGRERPNRRAARSCSMERGHLEDE